MLGVGRHGSGRSRWMDDAGGMEANAIPTAGDVTTNIRVGEGQCSHPIANMSSQMGVGLVGAKSQVDRVGCGEDHEGNS